MNKRWVAMLGILASLTFLTLTIPVMLGAIYTHLFRGVPSLAVVPALLLVPLVFAYWEQSALRERLGHAH